MKKYRSTVIACYVGYITQAIVNNLAPLLFVIFQRDYGVSTIMLSNLILLNFGFQLVVDALSVKLINRFGYRRMIVLAHASAAVGLVGLGVLPVLLPHPFVGLAIAVLFYAFGGGMIEVAVGPLMNALPSDEKGAAMSLLHSFYCWGQMLVVLISTLVLLTCGEQFWYFIPVAWALVPLINLFVFLKAPFAKMVSEKESCGAKALFTGAFPLFMLFMLAAGASELTVSQWASFFAEEGLGISKAAGDLFGPCLFALTMGVGRLLYGLFGSKWDVRRALLFCSLLCVIAYLMIALMPWPWLSLAGCAVCGFAVSLMWPGVISCAAQTFPTGGTLMFGVLALCGDAGCSIGPWIAGGISTLMQQTRTPMTAMKTGMLIGVVFPLLMVGGILALIRKDKKVTDRS